MISSFSVVGAAPGMIQATSKEIPVGCYSSVLRIGVDKQVLHSGRIFLSDDVDPSFASKPSPFLHRYLMQWQTASCLRKKSTGYSGT